MQSISSLKSRLNAHTQEPYAHTHTPGGDLPEPAAHRFPKHTHHCGAFLTTAEQIVRFVPGLIGDLDWIACYGVT